jgi:hypothetical protein
MTTLDKLRKNLKPGEVYRREDLVKWSRSVDRHLEALQSDGSLQKVATGLYYVPERSVFGVLPPDEKKLVRAFLKEDKFLLISRSAYNALGVGTTQLYNERLVYNRKRHGVVVLGGRTFTFMKKSGFRLKATDEFLLVDLVNNLDQLEEDQKQVLEHVKVKVRTLDPRKMKKCLSEYGDVKTKKILTPLLESTQLPADGLSV